MDSYDFSIEFGYVRVANKGSTLMNDTEPSFWDSDKETNNGIGLGFNFDEEHLFLLFPDEIPGRAKIIIVNNKEELFSDNPNYVEISVPSKILTISDTLENKVIDISVKSDKIGIFFSYQDDLTVSCLIKEN